MAEDLLLLFAVAFALLLRLFLRLPYNKPANQKVVISTGTTDTRTVRRVGKKSIA
jgi:hypothetical protein